MGAAGAAAGGGAAAAAAVAQATKASGVIIDLEPAEFQRVLYQADKPLVVVREPGGMFSKNWEYLFSYKGLAFHTKSESRVHLPGGCEVVTARKIWVP